MKKYAIRHKDGRWLKDASGYTPKFTARTHERREFVNHHDADLAHRKCVFLACNSEIIELDGREA